MKLKRVRLRSQQHAAVTVSSDHGVGYRDVEGDYDGHAPRPSLAGLLCLVGYSLNFLAEGKQQNVP